MWKATVLPLQKYPASSDFSRPDATGERNSPVVSGLEKPLFAGYYRNQKNVEVSGYQIKTLI